MVSERLGHATVAFTMDVYSHAIPALEAKAAQTIADLVFGAPDSDADIVFGPSRDSDEADSGDK